MIPVVLFHAGVDGLSGGFAGVDVFFVISGYLIASTILDQTAQGRFSLRQFYERRARRILPALLPVLAASAVLAWLLLVPEDFRKFAQALGATATFGANFLFARRTGYFDDDEGFRPLLHMWSLSVEEQFYLLFPLLMLALRHIGRARLALALAGLGLLSFTLMQALRPIEPALSFYMLPTRAWELLAGATCAALPLPARQDGRLATAGLALVAAGFIAASPASAPDWTLLLPVIGTALILLHAGPANLAGRALAWRPLTAIGAASYGIYLWHAPLLAFLRYAWLGEPPPLLLSGAIALAFALGFASLRLIEMPVRQSLALRRPSHLAMVCAGGLALALAAGAAGHFSRLEPRSATLRNKLGGAPSALPYPASSIPSPGRPVPYILYGDSHARQYSSALREAFGEGAMLTASGCLALPGMSNMAVAAEEAKECEALPAELAHLVVRRGIGTVVWAQRWDRNLFSSGSHLPLGRTSAEGRAAFLAGLDRLRGALPPGTRMVLVGNVPTAAPAGPGMAGGYLRCRAYVNATCPTSYPRALAEGHAINPVLAAYAERHADVTFFDPASALCHGGACDILVGGDLLYSDHTHLTVGGSRRVVGRMKQVLPAL